MPEGWRWERLDAVSPVNPRRNFDGIPDDAQLAFLGMAAIAELTGALDLTEQRSMASVRSGFTRFRSGDVIFAKITPCMENGKLAIIPDLPHGMGAGSTEFHVLEPQQVSARYLFHWLSQETFRNRAEHNMTGTAGQKRVPTDWLRNAPIPVPPSTAGQDAIVAHIDALFAEIDEGEAALAEARAGVETYRKALLKAAVTGELTADWRAANPLQETGEQLLQRILADRRARWHADPKNARRKYTEPAGPDIDGLPELPEGWARANIGQLAIVDSGATPKGVEVLAEPDGDIPWFKVSSMSQAGNEHDLRHSLWRHSRDVAAKLGLRIFPRGALVFPKLGGALLTNKRRVLAQDSTLDLNNMAVAALPPVKEYIWYIFTGIDLADLSDGSVVPQLKRDAVENIMVALPPASELEELVRRLATASRLAEQGDTTLADQVQVASTLRQSILAAAFRGELTT